MKRFQMFRMKTLAYTAVVILCTAKYLMCKEGVKCFFLLFLFPKFFFYICRYRSKSREMHAINLIKNLYLTLPAQRNLLIERRNY